MFPQKPRLSIQQFRLFIQQFRLFQRFIFFIQRFRFFQRFWLFKTSLKWFKICIQKLGTNCKFWSCLINRLHKHSQHTFNLSIREGINHWEGCFRNTECWCTQVGFEDWPDNITFQHNIIKLIIHCVHMRNKRSSEHRIVNYNILNKKHEHNDLKLTTTKKIILTIHYISTLKSSIRKFSIENRIAS